MKKTKNILSLIGIAAIISFTSCEKSEIMGFSENSAINFEYFQKKGINQIKSIEYSFLTNPTGEFIQEIPVIITGNMEDYDRQFAVEIINDETTTATPDQYEIIETTVRANQVIDTLRIKLFSSEELDNSTATIKLRLKESEDFETGLVDRQEFTISWTNQIVVPAWNVYYRTYFTSAASTQAYRIFVQTTGLTSFAAADYRALGAVGAEALGTKFGDYIKQWNKDNPNDILKHDDGIQKGQPITPVFYTHTKFD